MRANPNYTHIQNRIATDRIVLLQGGTRSGKTFAVIDWIINECLRYSGMEIDICRDTFTALKSTAWKDFENRLIQFGLYSDRNHNKTDHIYRLNGNTISYYGADDPDKVHGRARDILWINEAHQFPGKTIDQLFPRTRFRIIADYNPALPTEHWLDQYIAKYPPCITTYRDNPFLTPDQVADIESRNKPGSYWWTVYGNGQRMRVQGLIFPDWKKGEFPDHLPYIFGQDYGFHPDPTTLVKVALDEKNKAIYAKYCYHGQRLSTRQVFDLNMEHAAGNGLIIADGAEPRLISELHDMGLNIRRAIKGQDSVRSGIMTMSGYDLIICPDSFEIHRELDNYAWSDKKSQTPIDAFNHFIDAIRYASTWLIDQSINPLPKTHDSMRRHIKVKYRVADPARTRRGR